MKKIIYSGIYVVVFSVFLFFTYMFFKTEYDNHLTQEDSNKIVQTNLDIIDNKNTETDIIDDFKSTYSNDDIVGLLTIDSIGLSEPIVQGDDNEYYLNHLINKDYGRAGTTFMDYRNNPGSRQINIYGHSSKNYNLPFNILNNYADYEYYKKNRYINLYMNGDNSKYEIFSVALLSNDYEHQKLHFDNNDAWLNHLNKLKELSKFDTNVEIGGNDKILILQTCYKGNSEGILLIVSSRKV